MSTNDILKMRLEAVKRYESGESATEICKTLGMTRQWLYKWLKRKKELTVNFPITIRAYNRTPVEVEKTVADIRKKLQNTKYSQIGVNLINWELEQRKLPLLPAATINRIIKREHLQKKKLPYVPKGKNYPMTDALYPNNIHQADIVGPRFIKEDGRFYSLNVMDIDTHRVKINPCRRKSDEELAIGLIAAWKKLGLPDFLQMDNELSFRGSNLYPHSLGLILRMCLSLGIQPIFIPQREPWRNGEIESFQNTFDKAFFRSQKFNSFKELCLEALNFEEFHNEHYVYSCLNNKTPNKTLKESSWGIQLLHESFKSPKERIPINDGYIHFIRFIRSDRQLNIFGEKFTVHNDLVYEYVKATICTDCHLLQVRHDNQMVQTFAYSLPVDM